MPTTLSAATVVVRACKRRGKHIPIIFGRQNVDTRQAGSGERRDVNVKFVIRIMRRKERGDCGEFYNAGAKDAGREHRWTRGRRHNASAENVCGVLTCTVY